MKSHRLPPDLHAAIQLKNSEGGPEEARSYSLDLAAAYYRQNRFFMAHEILELQWRRETGPLKTYFHALIQVCLALVKVHELPNAKGALDQSERAGQKIALLLNSGALTPSGENELTEFLAAVKYLYRDLLAKLDTDLIMKPEFRPGWKHLFNTHETTGNSNHAGRQDQD